MIDKKVDNKSFFAMVGELLAEGKNVKIRVTGTSMLPTLSENDAIEMAPLAGEPRIGDVLLFTVGGYHVVHRLIGREGDIYVMQGDNNYVTERVERKNIIARLVSVIRADGTVITTDSDVWRRLSRRSLLRKRVKNFAIRWLGRRGRRQLRPWYFAMLAILMWAPLNGLGIPLDNYILGLRADHLLHASVFVPCALFLWDIIGPKWLLWLAAVAVGLVTEGGQWLLPYRGYDVNDLVANAIGVTLGFLVILIVRRKKKR